MHLFGLSGQYSEGIFQGCMPGLHAKGGRAGAVDGGGITDGCQQIGHVGIVRIPQIPLGLCCLQTLKIHMAHGLAHQFSATAGDQTVIFRAAIVIRQLLPAFFGGVTDTDALPGITVGA